jgi:glycosyltransferase involved in cell wall biosynthesis
MLGLASAQHNAGLKVTVVSAYAQGADTRIADTLTKAGVSVHLVGPVRTALGLHRSIKPTLAKAIAEADVVHIHGLWEDIQHKSARIARRLGKPYLIRPAGMLDAWSLGQSALKKKVYMALRLRANLNNAAAIHFTAQAEQDVAAPLGINTGAIIEPNGIDFKEYDDLPDPVVFRRACPQLGDRPYMLFMSRLHHKKGLDLLLPAYAGLETDTALVIAGPGDPEYINSLEQKVSELGAGNRVIFAGMVQGEAKLSALAGAELFVLCSYQENFGIVVAESLAAGTPVVISDQVNIHDAISEARVGGVVPTDTDALRDELARWLKDPQMRSEAAARAKPFVRDKYDWNSIAERWAGHYGRLAGDRAG